MPFNRSRTLPRALVALACLVFLVLVRTAILSEGSDFEIFWKTGLRLVRLEPIYVPEVDGGRCFKYPPWIAPFFTPLALFTQATGGMVWRLLLVAALGWTLLQLVRGRTEREKCGVLATLIAMIGIWNSNIQAGQLTTALCAVAMLPWIAEPPLSLNRTMAMLLGLSTKIFPLLTAAALGNDLRRTSIWWRTLLLAGALSVPALIATPGYSVARLLQDFLISASNTGSVLGGSMNGLPALISIIFAIPRDQMVHQSAFALASLGLVFLGWMLVHRRLETRLERAMLALALSICVTPLAYTYALGLAFPWFALRMASAAERRFQSWKDWAVVGALLWTILPLPFRALAPVLTLLAVPREASR